MPWVCESCRAEVERDDVDCPSCGQAKSSWTVVADKTRMMRVTTRRASLRCFRAKPGAPPPPGDALYDATALEPTNQAVAVPKALVQRLAETGGRPAPQDLLIARLRPREGPPALALTLDFARAEAADVELDEAHSVPHQDAFDFPLLFSYGGDVSELSIPGVRIVDLSEETDAGHAPEIEVGADGLKTQELEVVPRQAQLHVLELTDIHFHTDREVLLPIPPEEDLADALITTRAALKATFVFLEQNPAKRILVAGHTDSMGTDSHNMGLSERRAQNVYLYLSGERTKWGAHAFEHHEPADLQLVLKWAAVTRGWGCDPGEIDNQYGMGSANALIAFREAYNKAFPDKPPLTTTGGRRAEDWAAVYDVMDDHFALLLHVTPAELEARRAKLAFFEPPILACGEHQTREAPDRDDFESSTNRRVDLLFFDTGEEADLSAEPPGSGIYRGGFEVDFLEVKPEGLLIVKVVDEQGEAAPGCCVKLRLGDGRELEALVNAAGRAVVPAVHGDTFELLDVIHEESGLQLLDVIGEV